MRSPPRAARKIVSCVDERGPARKVHTTQSSQLTAVRTCASATVGGGGSWCGIACPDAEWAEGLASGVAGSCQGGAVLVADDGQVRPEGGHGL